MLKNDTLKNGKGLHGLYGSALPGIHSFFISLDSADL